ncbi:Type-2 restriction enzyme NgoMIV [Roseivivax sp. THAF40]|uniref:NgoMIV family type II restriction endonuclease n=1 Tax=unclassified Roseivivax TaxID=2639302 RepID=UPI00126813B6|nr:MULTISPECIES: NgoMIV family type II restriction endonuclease [unclassified Roseivivax]QFS81309.1 Type-2 restriction enzyme NgoMIV [Roseivivax sp. THAF197b]QFT45038.1 Type-2 restriction enzyme NgoMIV [Roseivivax sp. THAF40]
MTVPRLRELRAKFHATLMETTLTRNAGGVPSNADSSSIASKRAANGILDRLGASATASKLPGQTMGANFETACEAFVRVSLAELTHLRPGRFEVRKGGGISEFDQYEHLDELQIIASENREIATALGSDYLIKPDVVVYRAPESDAEINRHAVLVDADIARLSPLRGDLWARPSLHASISCKWTLRSDRAQNARSEGLNLVRNRKGRLPHIAVVTGEPLPSRISSLALGTGDIDCVYHFALPELRDALIEGGDAGYLDQLEMMIEGKRLRDIADLPLDLVI